MGNEPPEMIYASVCAEVCRFLLEVAKGGVVGGLGEGKEGFQNLV